MRRLRVLQCWIRRVRRFKNFRNISWHIIITSISIVSSAITDKNALVSFLKTANSARPSESRYFLQTLKLTHACLSVIALETILLPILKMC